MSGGLSPITGYERAIENLRNYVWNTQKTTITNIVRSARLAELADEAALLRETEANELRAEYAGTRHEARAIVHATETETQAAELRALARHYRGETP